MIEIMKDHEVRWFISSCCPRNLDEIASNIEKKRKRFLIDHCEKEITNFRNAFTEISSESENEYSNEENESQSSFFQVRSGGE